MQFQDDIATALYVVSPGAAIFTKYRLKHISKLREHKSKHGNSRSVFDDLIPSDPIDVQCPFSHVDSRF